MTNAKLIATPSRTTEIMRQYDIKMKKSLGQNFIVEPQILEKMIAVGDVDRNTTVIEIGPGIGALTEALALNAKMVLAFEIDHRFVTILEDTLVSYDNVEVIEEDILKVDFSSEEYAWLQEAERLVVVANLPYYITTPIIMHLIESQLPFDRLVMMMQKEVAERMTADVGTKQYSSLTIAINLLMETNLAFIVPKTVYIPKPNVDSAVLVLDRRPEPLVPVEDINEFQLFVQQAFKQRRKTIWNNLRHSDFELLANLDQHALQKVFDTTGIDPSRRGETLSIHEYYQLYEELIKKNKSS